MSVTIFTVLSGIAAPALFWTGYFYYKDRYQPEPLLKFGTAYLGGFTSAFVAFKCYSLLPLIGIPEDPSAMMKPWNLSFLTYSVGVVGLLEELFKFLPFFFLVIKFREFDEKTDGIIYASAVALGFASFENIFQLPYLKGFELFGRAAASPLTHTIFSSIWGYSTGKARLRQEPLLFPAAAGLFLAALVHGLYNFLTVTTPLRVLSALLILAVWIWRLQKWEKERK